MLVLLSTAAPTTAHVDAAAKVSPWQQQTLSKLQRQTLYLERVMHARPTTVRRAAKRRLAAAETPRDRDRILIAYWLRVRDRLAGAYAHPPYLAELTCIHRGEGDWHDTRNPVYDGGLQMDLGFESRYGGFLLHLKGRAYNWTPLEQIWTAVYAIRGPDHRGFYPWPMTGRACGLI
jgi:hypothetical protein